MAETWTLKGELALSCNCTVFCPCVLSLGQHPPTEGHCQAWAGIRVEEGRFGGVDLGGRRIGLFLEIPGLMARGNWTAGLFVDDEADAAAVEALARIFSGEVGGTTSLLSILVGNFLGVKQAPITYEVQGKTRVFRVAQIIEGAITPVAGGAEDGDVVISNSRYWIAPDVTVCKAEKSRVRVFGRNWNFAGRSAELCRIDWRGP